MENANRVCLDTVRKSMRQIRLMIGATVIIPELLTYAQYLRYDGYLRRKETKASVMPLFNDGTSIKRIAKRTGFSDTPQRILSGGVRTLESGDFGHRR